MDKKVIIGMVSVASMVILGACGNGNTNETTTNTDNQTSSSSKVSTSDNSSTSSLLSQEFEVSLDDAIGLFKTEHPDVAITSIEFDKNFGAYGYKIEGVDDTKEYELFIDSHTSEISKKREENIDSEDGDGAARRNDALVLDNIISPQKAMEIAFSEVSEQGDVTEWKLNQEIQSTFYEVSIRNGRNDSEIKIDSVSGTILETEQDD